ncbi:MAG: CBS domain-containing protein [Chlorobi bacterium]|nr:CBS domain-containing protein [Chlorobiota bacterium]
MYVKNWMSKKVVTVEESDTLSVAINTLKRNRIRRMPVMKDDKLVGIVSDRDLKEASPSKATSLDIWELHYLMSNIKIKDIMTRNPFTVNPGSTIEKCAIIMHDNKIGGLPVMVDEKLVGIITEQDIFEALINITGARKSGNRLLAVIPDVPGSIRELCDLMRKSSFKCVSILTSTLGIEEGKRQTLVRFQADKEDLKNIVKDVTEKYKSAEFTFE